MICYMRTLGSSKALLSGIPGAILGYAQNQIFNLYIYRFGLVNLINTYLRLKIHVLLNV